uniref:CDT1 domain-containing protein n=1 Tax=Caenorhabditis tropicalis TaxID=1561998 RepID=A0A1I7TKK0_9PELO
MSSRITRSRAGSENPQTVVTNFFKTTRKPRTRGEKKAPLEEDNHELIQPCKQSTVTVKEEDRNSHQVVDVASDVLFTDKKVSRTRPRTPTRQAELSTSDLTGTPPKRSKEAMVLEKPPVLPSENQDIVLDNPEVQKSALDVLMEASVPSKKKGGIKTVADLQSRLAAKGAAKAIHAQNLKNKGKIVDELAEKMKSPKKKILEVVSPSKSKAARALFTPKKSIPDYVVPGFNVTKSAEKIQEEEEGAYEEEGKRMTAEFLKKSRLIEEVKDSVRQRVELPSSYEHLIDSFKQIDQIVSIFLGQNRSCIAPELFKNIKNTSGRDFSDEHLSKILHVYPQSYYVEMREQRRAFGQAGKYELEVRPNLIEDLQGYLCEKPQKDNEQELPLVCPSKLLSPKKSPRKLIQAVPRKPQLDERIRLDAARQRDRAHILRYKLSGIVMEHHANFLESQGISNVSGLKRMHPLFRPNKHCPNLQKVELPRPPTQKSSVHIGMREALEMHTDPEAVSLPKFVQKVIDDLKSPQKASTGSSNTVPVSPKKFSEMQAQQKSKGGLSLLERIRAKEEIKKAAEACIDKDLEKKRQRLTLLKDRYVRIVCNHYIAKRVLTMEMEIVAKFVQYSSSVSSSIPEIVDHLKLMCDVAPMYVTEVVAMGRKCLRFTENNLEAINEVIQDELEKTTEKINSQKKNQIAQMSHTPRPKAARSLKFH